MWSITWWGVHPYIFLLLTPQIISCSVRLKSSPIQFGSTAKVIKGLKVKVKVPEGSSTIDLSILHCLFVVRICCSWYINTIQMLEITTLPRLNSSGRNTARVLGKFSICYQKMTKCYRNQETCTRCDPSIQRTEVLCPADGMFFVLYLSWVIAVFIFHSETEYFTHWKLL